MQIYDDAELLHMQHAAQQKRDAIIMHYLSGQKPIDRKAFGKSVQLDIAARLRAAGYCVACAGANDHYDLLVNGLRVEVKAASLSGGRYQADLRRNDADLLILVCRDTAGLDHHFVIDFADVRGLTHIEIRNQDPARYRGWMAASREAWHLIDRLIASGVNHWQPLLEGLNV